MKQRLLYGWNVSRVLFTVIGVSMIGQAIYEKQYLGILIGGYFTTMGLLGFGCASGACSTSSNPVVKKK